MISTKFIQSKLLTFPKGIFYMLLASFAFAAMGVFVKRLGKDFDSVEIVLFRNLLGVTFILLSILKKPIVEVGGKKMLLLFRGFIGTVSLYAFSYNLVHSSLGEAFTFYQTSSFFIAFFSHYYLGQKLNQYGWVGLFVGFIGIIIILRPDIELFHVNNAMGIMNGALSASAYLAVSELKKYYDTRSIVLSFMAWGIVLPLISMSIGAFYYSENLAFMLSKAKIPSWHHAPDIVMVGLSALMGQIYATRAFGVEKAGIVSAISYSNIIFSILLGWLIGDTMPDLLSFCGMALIIGSGLMVSLKK
jgi:drug/metabolite transporter (DMT)-like permease